MKKKIIILIILGCLNITAKAQFGGGDGTESSPYEIYTKAHLEELADSVNAGNSYAGKFFKVMNDINEPVTKSIGGYDVSIYGYRSFGGNFNGNNYKINLNIKNNSGPVGLFSSIKKATITNIITTGSIHCQSSEVGGIVGNADSSIILHSINFAKVKGEGSAVAGIAGEILNSCSVSFCQNLGSIEGNFCVGGIVGHAGLNPYNGTNGNTVSYSINAGYINGKMGGISGIVGHLGNWQDEANTIVINCINVGVVEGPPQRVSGIANIPE